MMTWLISASLRQRVLVLALACVLIVVGLNSLRTTPLDVFPEFAPRLPAVAHAPVLLSPLSSTSRALKIGISSKKAFADGSLRTGAVDDPAAAHGGPGRGECRDLGAA